MGLVFINYVGYVYLDSVTVDNNYMFESTYETAKALFLRLTSFTGELNVQNCTFSNNVGFGSSLVS